MKKLLNAIRDQFSETIAKEVEKELLKDSMIGSKVIGERSAITECEKKFEFALFVINLKDKLVSQLPLNLVNQIIGSFLFEERGRHYDIKQACINVIAYMRKRDWCTHIENNILVDCILRTKPELATSEIKGNYIERISGDDAELRTDIKKNLPGVTGKNHNPRDKEAREVFIANCLTYQYRRYTDEVKEMNPIERAIMFLEIVYDYIEKYNRKYGTTFDKKDFKEKEILIKNVRLS